jgi:hypothetical protein
MCLKLCQNVGKLHHNHNSFKEYCEFVRSHRFSSLTETTGTGEDVDVDAMKVTVGSQCNHRLFQEIIVMAACDVVYLFSNCLGGHNSRDRCQQTASKVSLSGF